MAGSLQVGVIAGIPIRIHWSLPLVFLYVAWQAESSGAYGLILAGLVFSCVLLHELGHSLTARRYGLATSSITLTFIGGLAMLEGRPTPKQEFWIALAGPLVNIVISAGLFLYMLVSPIEYSLDLVSSKNLVVSLFWANLVIGGFNLIPAFPLDGGRIIRAILSMAAGEDTGTRVSVGIGQAIAAVMFVTGLVIPEPTLVLIGLFVFFGASAELNRTTTLTALAGRTAREGMMTSLFTLNTGDSIGRAAEILLSSSQSQFPVRSGAETVGIIGRAEITSGLRKSGTEAYVAEFMRREFPRVDTSTELGKCAELLSASSPVLVVESEGQLVGMIDKENLSEFLMLNDLQPSRR